MARRRQRERREQRQQQQRHRHQLSTHRPDADTVEQLGAGDGRRQRLRQQGELAEVDTVPGAAQLTEGSLVGQSQEARSAAARRVESLHPSVSLPKLLVIKQDEMLRKSFLKISRAALPKTPEKGITCVVSKRVRGTVDYINLFIATA